MEEENSGQSVSGHSWEHAEQYPGKSRLETDRWKKQPVANSMEMVQNQGYHKIACGGFSAGCDMLLRAVAFSSAGRRSGFCCLGAVISTFGIPVASCHIVS